MSTSQPKIQVNNYYDTPGMQGMHGMHCHHGGFRSMMGAFGGAMAFGMLSSMLSNPGFGMGFGGYSRFF